MALTEVPTGAIADRFGRKVSLAMGALLYNVAMFAFTARVMSPVFIVGYLLWTTSNTLFSGADIAFLYDSLTADGQQAEFAKFSGRTNAVVQGAQAVGSPVGALVASYNMLLCFTVAGGLSVLAAVVALSFREPPTQDAATDSDGKLSFFQTIGPRFARPARAPCRPLSGDLRSSIAHLISDKVGSAVLIAGWPVSLILCELLLAAVPTLPSISLFRLSWRSATGPAFHEPSAWPASC